MVPPRKCYVASKRLLELMEEPLNQNGNLNSLIVKLLHHGVILYLILTKMFKTVILSSFVFYSVYK